MDLDNNRYYLNSLLREVGVSPNKAYRYIYG